MYNPPVFEKWNNSTFLLQRKQLCKDVVWEWGIVLAIQQWRLEHSGLTACHAQKTVCSVQRAHGGPFPDLLSRYKGLLPDLTGTDKLPNGWVLRKLKCPRPDAPPSFCSRLLSQHISSDRFLFFLPSLCYDGCLSHLFALLTLHSDVGCRYHPLSLYSFLILCPENS